MALDQELKNKIIFHLGYPGKVLIASSTHYNSVVNSRLNNLDVYTEDIVDGLIIQLDETRTKISSTQNKGNVKRIGDIEFDTARGSDFVTNHYRRLSKELSSLLDIPIMKRSSNLVGISGP